MFASDWLELTAAFAAFFASHAIAARPALRGDVTTKLGERGYLAVFSAVSLGILAWLVVAAGRAPYVELWTFAPWQLWLPTLG